MQWPPGRRWMYSRCVRLWPSHASSSRSCRAMHQRHAAKRAEGAVITVSTSTAYAAQFLIHTLLAHSCALPPLARGCVLAITASGAHCCVHTHDSGLSAAISAVDRASPVT